MSTIQKFLELIRFSHTVFALPFALFSAVLAWRETPFRTQDLLGILLCMVFARSAAMAFNRLVDRDIDADNPRTAARHLPAGLLSVRAVTAFTVVCSAGFVLTTLLFLPNRWPVMLSLPVLGVLLGYSYAKRFTAACHYWLSAALMLSPVAAWIAIRGELSWPPVMLAAVVFFWVGGFDIIYATQDAAFDRERGLFSLPARLGVRRSLRLAALSHLAAVICLAGLWRVADLGLLYLAGLALVSALLAYEHTLVREDDLSRVNQAFFQVNAAVSVGLCAIGILDVWLGQWWASSPAA
ncbi:MAG: putative 4-hydroxybenzoate polyprenyltransferase [Planctomyces sp.]|nr:putative 4-hydroxybenzoate polyprenyltransferase [Planctomyces sp.]